MNGTFGGKCAYSKVPIISTVLMPFWPLLHHNYCIIKKFMHQIGNPEVRNRQEQTGTDRNRQDYMFDIENYCIIIIA